MNYWICSILNNSKVQRLATRLCIALVCVASPLSFATDFGVATWGMSYDEIKQLETRSNLTPFGETDYLVYVVELPNIDSARIVYQFQNNQLIEGRFIFETIPLNIARSIEQYRNVSMLMSSKFGAAKTNETITNNGMPLNSSLASLAQALAADSVIFKSSWQTPTTRLVHQLAWNTDKPHHQIHYTALNKNIIPTM